MHKRLFACLLATAVCTPLMASPGLAQTEGQIEHYRRKYISFYYPQDFPLNSALAKAFRSGFPRFDYHLASTSLNLDFESFLAQTKAFEQQVAGDIAAGREVTNPRFGDKVVSWSETQQIAKAAYVFVPVWNLEAIELDGPYPLKSDEALEKDWTIHAKSDVELDMGLWSLAGESPVRAKSVEQSWTATRNNVYTVPVAQVLAAVARYNEGKEADDRIDLEESLGSSEREAVLKELRRSATINSALSRIEAQNPYSYMMDEAVKDVGYGSVISSIQRMPEFLIRAEIEDPDMARDQVGISLGEGETPKSLGIGLDEGYKIVEYVQGDKDPREVGYVKVRQLQPNGMLTQPIIVSRDFELGDQVVEYPKAGVGFNLRGGIMLPPDFSGVSGGGGALDLDFNIGPALGMSELYFLLSGGYYGVGPNGFVLLEAGIQKKWYMRQLIFALGLRGGGSLSELNGVENNGGGVTGMAGLHWQASPDFAFGVDAGWRQYSNFGGPMLDAFIRFDL